MNTPSWLTELAEKKYPFGETFSEEYVKYLRQAYIQCYLDLHSEEIPDVVEKVIEGEYPELKGDEMLEYDDPYEVNIERENRRFAMRKGFKLALSGSNLHSDGWVSVGERLPDEGTEVLVLSSNNHIYIRTYFISNNRGNFYNIDKPKPFPYTTNITHWQPLPTPPNK